MNRVSTAVWECPSDHQTDLPTVRETADVVVVGLGYVGLALIDEAVESGLSVIGLDVDAERVYGLARGRSPISDLTDADVAELLRRTLQVTTDPRCVGHAETVVICVPTPLGPNNTPELSAVEGATAAVGDHLRSGSLVVLESTTYPGTTEEVVGPLLQARSALTPGRDFGLAFSPERVNPGDTEFGFRKTPKVVGGLTQRCGDSAVAFYARIVDEVVRVSGLREAEMTKLLENTYRHVNIALINEMAVFSHEMNIDLWQVIDAAATKPFGFQPFYPGPGVGGHCIPIDPSYLSWAVRRLGYPFRFVELAQEINASMPSYVVTRVTRALNAKSKSVRGSRVLLLGVTYKANVGDVRESPAVPLSRLLLELGADVVWHDPFVDSYAPTGVELPRIEDPETGARDSDVTVLLQAHAAYDLPAIADAAAVLVDTRGVVEGERVERL